MEEKKTEWESFVRRAKVKTSNHTTMVRFYNAIYNFMIMTVILLAGILTCLILLGGIGKMVLAALSGSCTVLTAISKFLIADRKKAGHKRFAKIFQSLLIRMLKCETVLEYNTLWSDLHENIIKEPLVLIWRRRSKRVKIVYTMAPRLMQAFEGKDEPEQNNNGDHRGYNRDQPGYPSTQRRNSGTRQGYNGTHQGYNGIEQRYNGTHQGYNGTQQGYNGTHQGFNGTQQGYSGTQQRYNGTQQGFNGTQQGYEDTQRRHSGTQHVYSNVHEGRRTPASNRPSDFNPNDFHVMSIEDQPPNAQTPNRRDGYVAISGLPEDETRSTADNNQERDMSNDQIGQEKTPFISSPSKGKKKKSKTESERSKELYLGSSSQGTLDDIDEQEEHEEQTNQETSDSIALTKHKKTKKKKSQSASSTPREDLPPPPPLSFDEDDEEYNDHEPQKTGKMYSSATTTKSSRTSTSKYDRSIVYDEDEENDLSEDTDDDDDIQPYNTRS